MQPGSQCSTYEPIPGEITMSFGKILIVEDEEHIQELLRFNLQNNGYDVLVASDGLQGLTMAKEEQPDLMLLDLMLPKMDGLDVCRAVKSDAQMAAIPIIMLTAKGSETDKVLGLELGADDYLTKPFSVRELMARIKVVLRRGIKESEPVEQSKIISIDNLVIDIEKHVVHRDGIEFQLTLKEFELLKELILNRGKVLTRNYLLDTIWGYDYYGETRTVDVHVRHLRKKIESEEHQYIETVRGIGYKIR